jgi:hypothetical protein
MITKPLSCLLLCNSLFTLFTARIKEKNPIFQTNNRNGSFRLFCQFDVSIA